MSLLQEFLRNGGTLDDLKVKYAIDATRHKRYPNLVLLKYDQLNSPFAEPIAREARGIILDEADDWRVVCMRFRKFANYGEGYAAPVNFKTAKATIKEDGSLVTLYYYRDEWHVATSGSPDAGGPVGDFGYSFADLFWRVFKQMELRLPHDTNLCPSFELMTPWNEIVVRHQDEKLVLIGLHDRATCEELPLNTIDYYPVVRSFDFASLDDLLSFIHKLNGSEQEGFVLTDVSRHNGDFARVKIKSPDYVAKHHLKSSWSIRKAVEVVRRGEVAEVSLALPAFADQLNEIAVKYNSILTNLDKTYAEIQGIENNKDFALELQKRKSIGFHALYALRRNHVKSISEYMLDLHIDSVVDMLGLKTEKE